MCRINVTIRWNAKHLKDSAKNLDYWNKIKTISIIYKTLKWEWIQKLDNKIIK